MNKYDIFPNEGEYKQKIHKINHDYSYKMFIGDSLTINDIYRIRVFFNSLYAKGFYPVTIVDGKENKYTVHICSSLKVLERLKELKI